MACVTASLPSARFQTAAVSAGTRSCAGAAAPAAAATIKWAGPKVRAGPEAVRKRGASRKSCAHAAARRLAVLDDGLRACAHACVDSKQEPGRPTIGAVYREAPAELLALGAQCGAVIGQ